jgi:hypothetical protein
MDTKIPVEICMLQEESVCEDCGIEGELMCRFERGDLATFLLLFIPFGVAAIAGVIRAGYGLYLIGFAAFAFFFFFVWEARILCSHCPYWAEEGNVLHCHANYGVFKIWKYNPKPMSQSEQVQFLAGALILIVYPFPFMLLGGEYLLAVIALSSAVGFAYNLIRNTCTRCVNFSCPLNRVAKPVVDAYLRRNPVMRVAWEESGYKLAER